MVWAGPVFGVAAPLATWGLAAAAGFSWAFLLRFFSGFCLIANGVYIGAGSFDGVGDCGQMLRHGSEMWQLWLFGVVTTPVGLLLWHGQGPYFGLGNKSRQVNRGIALGSLLACIALIILGFVVG